MDVHGYTESGLIDATIDGVRWSVPDDMENRFRLLIAAWEADGNTISAYEAPVLPIPSLEPWRFYAVLDLSGKRPNLEAFIEALSEPEKTVARNKLERSLVFFRDNDLVLAAQQALGMTDEQLDALWLQAASL